MVGRCGSKMPVTDTSFGKGEGSLQRSEIMKVGEPCHCKFLANKAIIVYFSCESSIIQMKYCIVFLPSEYG